MNDPDLAGQPYYPEEEARREPRPPGREVPIDVSSMDLQLDVRSFATGWQTALQRPPKVNVQAVNLTPEATKVVSIKVRAPCVQVRSYTFPELPDWCDPPASTDGKTAPLRIAKEQTPAKRRTRILPPSDIIKLQDRLYYLLQPSLETLVQGSQLYFPFEPFPYQLDGVAFLYPRFAAILADEMGLGKTMQAITAIRLLLRSGEVRSVLLICPKPLVSNWKREFAMWAPELPLGVIEGDQNRRSWQWRQTQVPVKIANYELLLRDADLLENEDLHFDLVALDEAQRIKNRSSTTSRVARSIHRSRSWALTGTPVENSPEDLVAIFEFLLPGFLASGMQARRIGQATRDHILRRTKDMVLTDLPPKLFRDAELDLSREQWEAYRIAEDEGVVRLADMGEDLTIQHVFELVLRLKQICNFDPYTMVSSKMERLEADLEEVAASGQKAIVFSQWVQTISRMAERLERFGPLQYHGKVRPNARDGVIEQFRKSDRHHVLLMSYGAGSVGLNLQFCRYVFLFDRWWNPAVEDQAINRAHRIGVDGPVTVTRMLTMGTIEQRIHQVLEEKRQLSATVFSEAGTPKNLGLTQQDVFGLFDLRMPSKPSTKAA